MYHIIVFILILRFPLHNADKTKLPVLLIDEENVLKDINVNPNPFAKMSAAQFTNILFETKKRSEAVVIFVEDKLSTEDLSTKDKFGTPYKYMHDILRDKKVKYFPGVADPYKLLIHVFEPVSYNVFYLNSAMHLRISDKSFKYIYVYLQDGANLTRAESLRQHDMVIRDVNAMVRKLKPGPIVSFYTGKMNPVEVAKLEFVHIKRVDETQDFSVLVRSRRALFRFIGVYSATPTRRANFDQVPVIGEESWSTHRLSTKMAYTDFELEFQFGFEDEHWRLDSVSLLEGGEEVGRTRMSVSVPWGFSYLCGEPLVVVNRRDNSFVSVSQYQIQPRRRRYLRQETDTTTEAPPAPPAGPPDNSPAPPVGSPVDPPPVDPPLNPPVDPPLDPPAGPPTGSEPESAGSSSFDTAINCGPYFNTNILATLFVTFICLGIATSGIVVLMSCNTNSNYDDAQGKPLVIASEASAS